MIVTGDVTQTDLPNAAETGLVDAAAKLSKTPGVAFVHLDRSDVVRHNLVQQIIDAYGEDDAKPAIKPRRGRAGETPSDAQNNAR